MQQRKWWVYLWPTTWLLMFQVKFDNFLQLFQSLKWFYFCSNVKKWLQPLSSFWMCSSGSWPSPRFTGVSFWLLKFDSQWIKCQTISNVFFAFDCNSNQCCGAFEHLRWKHWITHSSYLHILVKQYLTDSAMCLVIKDWKTSRFDEKQHQFGCDR